jgi:hypothetical protein
MRSAQLQLIAEQLGAGTAQASDALTGTVDKLEAVLRLPLAELAVAQLAARPLPERATLRRTLDALARVDGTISVFEYCLSRLLDGYLGDAEAPRARSRPGRKPVTAVEAAAINLLAVVAAAGNADPAAAEHAFMAAMARLLPGRPVRYAPPGDPWRTLDAGWEPLNGLDPQNKKALIEALVIAVSDDGVLTAEEAELLRTACGVLRCPLPPLVE